jgi:hypothetical protein
MRTWPLVFRSAPWGRKGCPSTSRTSDGPEGSRLGVQQFVASVLTRPGYGQLPRAKMHVGPTGVNQARLTSVAWRRTIQLWN